jgi:16S rRNA (guanine1516-N2)-methyltransferase
MMMDLIKIKISQKNQIEWPAFLQDSLAQNVGFRLDIESEQKLCNLCDYLYFDQNKLFFHSVESGEMSFDFEQMWNYHQKQNYALSKEPLAKALGIKGEIKPFIWDSTCGTGKDSVLIKFFGSRLFSFERNPIIYLLLQDALRRFPMDLTLHNTNASTLTSTFIKENRPDVIYYDPMYPEKLGSKKSALPRKEMQIFKQIVGEDLDCIDFVTWAKSVARERVVVKRSLAAKPLLENPTASYEGKSTRYDMYKIF